MSVLTDQAAAALAAERNAEAQQEQNDKDALRTAARNALLAVISPVTWAQSNLSVAHTDLPNRLVVVGDGTVSLAVQQDRETEEWGVFLVTGSETEWTTISGKLDNLADLGKALEETS